MKFFIDTANVDEIRKANELGVISGVTTNPSLIAKSGRDIKEVIREITEIVDGPISAEVSANLTTAQEMVKEALELVKIHENIVVKLPMTLEGLKATKELSARNIKTNVTLIFSLNQAMLAARAGATYVSPFVGRIDDINMNGIDLIKEIASTFKYFGIESKIISASIRTTSHVSSSAIAGADIATIPYALIEKMSKHPLTDAGIERFIEDYNAVFGDK